MPAGISGAMLELWCTAWVRAAPPASARTFSNNSSSLNWRSADSCWSHAVPLCLRGRTATRSQLRVAAIPLLLLLLQAMVGGSCKALGQQRMPLTQSWTSSLLTQQPPSSSLQVQLQQPPTAAPVLTGLRSFFTHPHLAATRCPSGRRLRSWEPSGGPIRHPWPCRRQGN